MEKNKKVPNPYEKKGGELHQKKIKEISDKIDNGKLDAVPEQKIDKVEEGYRFADVVGIDKNQDIKEIHQIGRQNKNGTPVNRERKAIEDIEKATRLKVIFHPYNILFLLCCCLLVLLFIYTKVHLI